MTEATTSSAWTDAFTDLTTRLDPPLRAKRSERSSSRLSARFVVGRSAEEHLAIGRGDRCDVAVGFSTSAPSVGLGCRRGA